MDSYNFIEKMQRLSNQELAEIARFGERDGYLPDVVLAARNELASRNLTSTELATVADSIETTRLRNMELASQPLSWPARMAFFILPVVGWPVMAFIALSFATRGYWQKSSEAGKWMGLGIVFWIGLVVILVVLQFGYF